MSLRIGDYITNLKSIANDFFVSKSSVRKSFTGQVGGGLRAIQQNRCFIQVFRRASLPHPKQKCQTLSGRFLFRGFILDPLLQAPLISAGTLSLSPNPTQPLKCYNQYTPPCDPVCPSILLMTSNKHPLGTRQWSLKTGGKVQSTQNTFLIPKFPKLHTTCPNGR